MLDPVVRLLLLDIQFLDIARLMHIVPLLRQLKSRFLSVWRIHKNICLLLHCLEAQLLLAYHLLHV
jgi:hypothetical protein